MKKSNYHIYANVMHKYDQLLDSIEPTEVAKMSVAQRHDILAYTKMLMSKLEEACLVEK